MHAEYKISASFEQEANLRDFPFDIISWDVKLAILSYSVGLLPFKAVSHDYIMKGSELRSFDEFETFGLLGGATLSSWTPDYLQASV